MGNPSALFLSQQALENVLYIIVFWAMRKEYFLKLLLPCLAMCPAAEYSPD